MTSDTTVLAPARASAGRSLSNLTRGLAALAMRLWVYRQNHRERAQLRALSDRELRDIGISRCDALQEAKKPFWR
ncbi:MAG: DUF1127 domain-containing protein [Alphaproteobacteria bacterium]|nr:DUF1127 domain-containing protein [Alphaproteobacteria bacterium]